jgi:transcription elongation factor Elf1
LYRYDSGLKPFECQSCGKALSSRNALKVHTKVGRLSTS